MIEQIHEINGEFYKKIYLRTQTKSIITVDKEYYVLFLLVNPIDKQYPYFEKIKGKFLYQCYNSFNNNYVKVYELEDYALMIKELIKNKKYDIETIKNITNIDLLEEPYFSKIKEILNV